MDSDFYKYIEVKQTDAIRDPLVDVYPDRRVKDLTVGIKYDEDKPRYDLIPPEALDGLARLFGMGAKKYSDRNWELGMGWSRIFAAMMRHAWKWFRGEAYDEQDGQHHLLSVIFCAMALYTYSVRNKGTDDRPKVPVAPQDYERIWRKTPSSN